MGDGKSWFLEKQQQITDRVGEPVLLVVKMPFDAWFEVEINTFTGRMGMATGQEVETTVEQSEQSGPIDQRAAQGRLAVWVSVNRRPFGPISSQSV